MYLSGEQIRERFISYFRDKRGHLHLPSSSLIPDNPTLLLTSAGMVQFVPIFLGQSPPTDPPRAVTAQKCARAGGKDSDIENVGRTARHHSFFEMMGNFSFGDYFKAEVIPWAWQFVTEELELDPNRLSVTIFAGDEELPADEEAFEIWNKKVGIPAQRIYRMSKKDNFWGPPGPTGPCGPCSEIYYDRGEAYGCSSDSAVCGIGKCECDRYLEFWNLVFMELFKDENGKFIPLARKNVDTGLGLDRVALILQKKNNSFETDLLFPLLQKTADIAGTPYSGTGNKSDVYLKIITDHARCVTFLIADGIRMSNVGRGYVLRFITRRAARFGRLLGIKEPFIYKLVPTVKQIYGNYYNELTVSEKIIERIIKEEEERFAKTVDRGMNLLEELLTTDNQIISGASVFDLYSTYGFPLELTAEIAKERGKSIDMEGFVQAKKAHEQVSAGNKFNVIITGDDYLNEISKKNGGTKFTGYEELQGASEVVAIILDGKPVGQVQEGDEADIVLNTSPFYGESGGQVGDIGQLENDDSKLLVLDTKKQDKLHLHKVRVVVGDLEIGQTVKACVDKGRRIATMLHHSSAHLFHAAVRDLFGKQVVQAGSCVGPNTMRFDFTLDRQPTPNEIAKLEKMMNEWVRSGSNVTTAELPLDEAKQTGALAMFGEKYGDLVRVVRMGDFSLEFCGGTHVANTGEIGPIKIVSEGSIASGVRRVEAVSGPVAWQFIAEQLGYLTDAAERLKTRPSDLVVQIEKLQDQLKQREKLNATLQERLALARIADLLTTTVKVGDINFIQQKINDLDAESLTTIAEKIRCEQNNTVVALACVQQGKVTLVVGVSESLVARGFKAGNLVKEAASIIGGSGGGRPQLARAGGSHPEKLQSAFEKLRELVALQPK